MRSRNTVRADLNNLRRLLKSIRLLEAAMREGGGAPLSNKLSLFKYKRDIIYKKYEDSIKALSPEEGLIFTLYYQQGLTQSQVATKTNYCKSSITKHLSAIISKMKEDW